MAHSQGCFNLAGLNNNTQVRPKVEFDALLKQAGATKDILSMSEVMFYLNKYIYMKKLGDQSHKHIVHCSEDPLGQVLGVKSFSMNERGPLLTMIMKNLVLVRSQESSCLATQQQVLQHSHSQPDRPPEHKVRPTVEFYALLKQGGATKDMLSMGEVISYLSKYIYIKRLYDPVRLNAVHCSEDPLGQVLGVKSFSVKELGHIFTIIMKNLVLVRSQEPSNALQQHSHSQPARFVFDSIGMTWLMAMEIFLCVGQERGQNLLNKQLADSEERLRAKDQELERTKAEKTQQERVFKQNLGNAMQELADREKHLRAKDQELEETKAEKTQQESVFKQKLGEAMLKVLENDETIQKWSSTVQLCKEELRASSEKLKKTMAKCKKLQLTNAEKTQQERVFKQQLGEANQKLKKVKKLLADSEERLRAKDKKVEETKAVKTRQERVLKQQLGEANQKLVDSEEHLWAKDQELEESKAEKTQKEEEFKVYKQQLEDAGLEKDKTIRKFKGQFQATQKKLRDKRAERRSSAWKALRQGQEKDGIIQTLKRQLSHSEEALQTKDRELQDKLKKVNKQLADSEESLQTKEKELEETKERAQQTQEEMEKDLQCGVCKEVFIDPVLLNCGHTFCKDCIRRSREVKDQCPECRAVTQTRNLALEKCIELFEKRLPPNEKAERQALVTVRANQQEGQVNPDPMAVTHAEDVLELDSGFLSPFSVMTYMSSPSPSVYSPGPSVYSPGPSVYSPSPAVYSPSPAVHHSSPSASENDEPRRPW